MPVVLWSILEYNIHMEQEKNLNGSPEEIKKQVEDFGRNIGVQILFEIDPNKSVDEIENIYRQTLDFLNGLSPEQINKLKTEKADIYISGLDDLNSLANEFYPGYLNNENDKSVGEEKKEEEPSEAPFVQEAPSFVEQNNPLTFSGQSFENQSADPNIPGSNLGVEMVESGDAGVDSVDLEMVGSKKRNSNFEKIDGVHVHMSRFVSENFQITNEQKDNIWREIDGALCGLEQNELKILQNKVTILIKDDSVSNPVFQNNILVVGIFSTGEEILNAIRKTVIPSVIGEISVLQNEEISDLVGGVNSVDSPKDDPNSEKRSEFLAGLPEDLKKEVLDREAQKLSPEKLRYTQEYKDYLNDTPGKDGEGLVVDPDTQTPDLREGDLLNKPKVATGSSEPEQNTTNPGIVNGAGANPEVSNNATEFNIDEIKNSEEWKRFEILREDLARKEAKQVDADILTLGVELDRSEYNTYKDLIRDRIKESLVSKEGADISPEKIKEIEEKANEIRFELFVKEESDIYRSELKEKRASSLAEKGLGHLVEIKNQITNKKAVEWYRSLSWPNKIFVSSLLFTPVALVGAFASGAGVSGALATVGYRGARVGFGLAGAYVGNRVSDKGLKWGEKKFIWTNEEINKFEKEELEKLKNSVKDADTLSRKYEEIRREVEKRRAQLATYKATAVIGGGVGAGALSGVAMDGAVGAPKPQEQNINPSESNTDQVGDSEATFKNNQESDNNPETNAGAENEQGKESKGEGDEKTGKEDGGRKKGDEGSDSKKTEGKDETSENIESKSFKFVPAKGDSSWKLIQESISDNPKFDEMIVDMTPDEMRASRSFVVSNYLREALKTPEKFGMGTNGEVYVGKEIDLTELLKDEDKLSQIIEKAKKLSPQQIQTINENDAKILSWVQNPKNQGVRLTNDKVTEILNTKVVEASNDVEAVEGGETGEMEEDVNVRTPEEDRALTEGSTPENPNINDEVVLDPSQPERSTVSEAFLEQNEAKPKEIFENSDDLVAENQSVDRESLQREIEEAKERLKTLEGGGLRTYAGDSIVAQEIENAYMKEIDEIYGKNRFMGFFHTHGVNTPEWNLMARLPAREVVEFYSGDSSSVDLPQEITNELANSENHRNLWTKTDGLLKEVKGVVKPFENEKMSEFVKRLGGFVYKKYTEESV